MTVDLEETQLLQDIKSSDYFHESALKNLVENSALAADLSKLLYKHPNINLPLETNVQQQLFDKLRVIHQDSLAKKYYFRDISEFPQVLATEDQVSNLALSNLDIHGRLSDLNSEIDQINLSLSDNISKLEEGKGKLNESLQNLSILKQKAGESELEKVRLSTLKQVITDQEISDKKQYLTQQIEKNAQLTSKLSDPMQKHAVLDMTRQALLKEIEQLESSKLQMEEFANQTIIHANAVDPRLDYLGKWLTKTKSIMYGISGIESIISSEKDIVISYEKDGEVDAFKLTLTFNESEATFINAKVDVAGCNLVKTVEKINMLFLNKDRVLKVLVHECKIAVKNFVRKSNEMFRLSNDVLYDESTGQVGWSVKCIGGDVNVVVGLGERYPMDGMKLLSVSWPSGYLADESSRIKAIEQELEKSGWTVEKLLRSDLFQ